MATYTSAATGLWSANATWVGGVKPPSGAGHKVVIASGHVVTYDEAAGTYGNDTSTGIQVEGTLKFSRSTSTKLTCRGDLYINAGTLDAGTEDDPIPANVTVEIELNDSATQANRKYSLRTNTGATFAGIRFWGAEKTRITTLTGAVASNVNSFPLADATGWLVGDVVIFAPYSSSPLTIATRKIASITPGVGPAATITLSGTIGAAYPVGHQVMNVTRNVRVYGKNGNTFETGVQINWTTGYTANIIEIGPCEFLLSGGSAGSPVQLNSGLNFYSSSGSSTPKCVKKLYRFVVHDVWNVVGSTPTLLPGTNAALVMFFGSQADPYDCTEPLLVSMNRFPVLVYSGFSGSMTRPIAVSGALNGGFSQGPVNFRMIEPTWFAGSRMFGSTGITLSVSGGAYYSLSRLHDTGPTAFGALTFENINLNAGFGMELPTNGITWATGASFQATWKNCLLPSGFRAARASANLNNASASMVNLLLNKNNDVTDHERYMNGGRMTRDNSFRYRGKSSMKVESWYSTQPYTFSWTVTTAAGAALRLVGYVQYNSAFGTATPPTVTISGLGITPVVFTAPATADTWHKCDISATNPNAYTGDFTVTISAVSAANTETAFAWFDGFYVPPWIDVVRHYGFLYDAAYSRTVDPVVVSSEATVAAMTGIAYASNTITVSSNRSVRDLYDWIKYYEASNQDQAILMTSTDGVNFTLNANLTLSGATLSGSGVITLASGRTFSATGGGDTDVVIVSGAGRRVKIKAPNLISGSRVQLYDVAGTLELLNTVIGSGGATHTVNWTTDKTIRLRAEHSTKLPMEVTDLLTSAGLSFLNTQDDDTVYNANGIDGSTCTEFSADGPNIQIDINDSDGVTSIQRLYAWMQWYQTTSAGIASTFYGAMSATDAANYVIDQTKANIKLDNVTGSPLVMSGGYLIRKDGSTVIAATSGSIQMDPGRAYVAPGSGGGASAADVWNYATRTLTQYSLPAGERIITMQPDGKILAR